MPLLIWYGCQINGNYLLILTKYMNTEINSKSRNSYFSRLFNGRMNRKSFTFSIFCLSLFVSIPSQMIREQGYNTAEYGVIALVLLFVYLFYMSSVVVRRSHDIGKGNKFSAIILILSVIPLFSIPCYLYLQFKTGDAVDNQYGGQPTKWIGLKELFALN